MLAALASPARADVVPGLFDTGVDANGNLLVTGAVDPHYELIASADPSYPGPQAYACEPIPGAYWLANGPNSRWISPAIDENYPALGTPHPGGEYLYRLTFDLTGYDPATVVLSGAWGVDNSGAMRLNGAAFGNPNSSYNPLVPFSITSGFLPGVNHLDFAIHNVPSGGSNPTGLRVDGLTATATPLVSVEGVLPGVFRMLPPRPSPARGRSHIVFDLPRPGRVRATIRDLTGRDVWTLANREFPAGRVEVVWEGQGPRNSGVAPGVYFAEVEFEGMRAARRILWVR